MQSNDNVISLSRPAAHAADTGEARVLPALPQHVGLSVPASEDDGMVTFVSLMQRIVDPAIVFAVLVTGAQWFNEPFEGQYLALGIIGALLAFMLFRQAAGNQPWHQGGAVGLVSSVLGSWMMLIGLLMLVGVMTDTLDAYHSLVIYTWIGVTPVFILLQHLLARMALLQHLHSPTQTRRAVIVGINPLSMRLMESFREQSDLGLSFLGFFDDRNQQRTSSLGAQRFLGQLSDLPEYVKCEQVHLIYIALPMVKRARILALLESLRDTTASIYFVPDLFVFDLIQGRIGGLNGLPVVAVCETPFRGIKAVIKRMSDVVLSMLIVTLIAPLLAAIAVAVKWSSPGPVLFKQRRYGMDGREILIYKFRTMSVCEDGDYIIQARAKDPRVTRIGMFLRRTSLDELPQFINVLQGRMSIVGPRPHAVAHNELYRKLIKGYMVRHKVRPGITGWAQVNGYRGETEQIEKMQRRIEYDLDYLRRWSLGLDLKIIFRTVFVLFRDQHAY